MQLLQICLTLFGGGNGNGWVPSNRQKRKPKRKIMNNQDQNEQMKEVRKILDLSRDEGGNFTIGRTGHMEGRGILCFKIY